jgi:hypothetical protein
MAIPNKLRSCLTPLTQFPVSKQEHFLQHIEIKMQPVEDGIKMQIDMFGSQQLLLSKMWQLGCLYGVQ